MGNEDLSLVCLDASIYPKLFIEEKYSSEAAFLFDELINSESRIIEPSFLRLEFYSVIRKKRVLDDLIREKALSIMDIFDKFALEFVQESDQLIRESYYIAERLGLTVIYDCIYLSLARTNDAVFITADELFAKKAKKTYQKTYTLKDFSEQVFQ